MNQYVAIVLLCTFAHQGPACTEETAVRVDRLETRYPDKPTCLRAGREQSIVIGEQIGHGLGRGGWFRVRCPKEHPA